MVMYNGKFDDEKKNNGILTIISENNGETTFTATLYSNDGNVIATDIIEMKSKVGFLDKFGSFFPFTIPCDKRLRVLNPIYTIKYNIMTKQRRVKVPLSFYSILGAYPPLMR